MLILFYEPLGLIQWLNHDPQEPSLKLLIIELQTHKQWTRVHFKIKFDPKKTKVRDHKQEIETVNQVKQLLFSR